MMRKGQLIDYFRVAILVAALGCIGMTWEATHITYPQTITNEEALTMEPNFKSTYLSGGLKHTVTTYKVATETDAEAAARHAAKLAAYLVEFPADA